MIFSRDYIGYLARRTVKHLIDAKMITTSDLKGCEARVTSLQLTNHYYLYPLALRKSFLNNIFLPL